LFYTLKGVDSYRLVDLREHVRLLESQVWITSDALPLAVQTVLSYNYYSPIKSTIDARDPENMLKDFTETIVKKAIATHTALEFVTQKKKLQIYIRVSIRLKMLYALYNRNIIIFGALFKGRVGEINSTYRCSSDSSRILLGSTCE
jgi:hypothetical protein